MPTLNPQQLAAAFTKYQAQFFGANTTTQNIFTSWLGADVGASEKYINNNSAAKPSQSLEEFKSSVSTKAILQKTPSGYALAGAMPANDVAEVMRFKRESAYQKTLPDTSILLKNHNVKPKNIFIFNAWKDRFLGIIMTMALVGEFTKIKDLSAHSFLKMQFVY